MMWMIELHLFWERGNKEIQIKTSTLFVIKSFQPNLKISETILRSGLKKENVNIFATNSEDKDSFQGGCNKNINIIISDKL